MFTALYRNALWITAPLMCVSGLLLGLFIRNVVHLVRDSKVLSVPLVEQQTIELPEAGSLVLCAEGPRFSRRFAHLAYELSTEHGAPVEGRTTLFHATTSGISTARREERVYEIPHPGRYVLRVRNLGAHQPKDSEHRLVFVRPHLGQSTGYVIGIVFSAMTFIASLVFFLLRLTRTGLE